ncbi:MAG: hypothetical protein KTR20_09060 [Cellvibrionaceae bacterium]|nr:hypothetical protein [Cellvibrionaceae bacterium]
MNDTIASTLISPKRIGPSLRLSLLLLALQLSAIAEEPVLYRYKKADGLQVISSQIPAEFVSQGYDILSPDGRVLKTIAAEPSAADKERLLREQREQQRLATWDKELLRRYSHVDDIRSAKQRKLNQLANAISLRYRNIDKINEEIDRYQALAADQERQGRAVTEEIIKKMALLKEERAREQAQAKRKAQEQQQVTQAFDADIQRFKIIRPEE